MCWKFHATLTVSKDVTVDGQNITLTSDSQPFTITVVPPLPSADNQIASDIAATAAVPFDGSVAMFTDYGAVAEDFSGVTVDWGDGSTSAGSLMTINADAGVFAVYGAHTFAAPTEEGSPHQMHVTLHDVAGGDTVFPDSNASVAALSIETLHVQSMSLAQSEPYAGDIATFSTDAGVSANDLTATIGWGDGTSSSGTVVAGESGSFTVTGSHTYTIPGLHTVSVTVTGGGTEVVAEDGVATVTVVLAAADTHGTAGLPVSGTLATFSDTGNGRTASSYTATVQWGDETSSAGTVTDDGSGNFAVEGTHTYASSGNYVVTVALTDTDGDTWAAVSANPSILITALAIGNLHVESLTVTAHTAFSGTVGTFVSDAGAPSELFAVTIDWGDGTTSTGVVTAGDVVNGMILGSNQQRTFTVAGAHTYTAAGTYTIGLTIAGADTAATASGSASITTDLSSTASVTTTPSAAAGTTTAGVAVTTNPPAVVTPPHMPTAVTPTPPSKVGGGTVVTVDNVAARIGTTPWLLVALAPFLMVGLALSIAVARRQRGSTTK